MEVPLLAFRVPLVTFQKISKLIVRSAPLEKSLINLQPSAFHANKGTIHTQMGKNAVNVLNILIVREKMALSVSLNANHMTR